MNSRTVRIDTAVFVTMLFLIFFLLAFLSKVYLFFLSFFFIPYVDVWLDFSQTSGFMSYNSSFSMFY